MAELPTPEESARMVLNIYRGFGTRPGEGLMTQHFLDGALKQGLNTQELLDGLVYGEGQGWFENGPNGLILLTEAGFKEI